jgi:PadR family transcriptional regulator PadR
MIHSDVIRGHIDTIILKLLSERDMYGYELSNEIKARTQQKFDIKEATLYAVLQRLESRELISSYMGEKSLGRQRRYYRISRFGKAYFQEMLVEWNLLQEIMKAFIGGETE